MCGVRVGIALARDGTVRLCADGSYLCVAGGADGLRQGGHIVAPTGSHPANVLVTLMNAAGANASALGDVQGTVPGLVG